MNTFTFSGIIHRIKKIETKTGGFLLNVTIRVKTSRKDEQGRRINDFFNCKVMGKTAELVDTYFKEGSGISALGDINNVSYEKDGKKIYKTDFLVSKVFFPPKATAALDESVKNEYPNLGLGDDTASDKDQVVKYYEDVPF